MSWGGAPRCTTCQQAVYHAEQVMGPGRKVYHKLCLKCRQCEKRLDPGGLVEHDGDPYCQRCHTQLFGTRDLRHANLHSSPISTPNPSRSTIPQSPTPSTPLAPTPLPLSPRPRQPPAPDFYTPPHPIASSSTIHDARPMTTPQSPPIALDASTEITRPNFRAERPISVPYAGGVKALDERGMLMRGNSPRSKVGERMSVGEDTCWGCTKRVYAAEQVFAIHHKWHRWCLKCISCRTTLDPSKVSDREGMPYCKNCYAKEHGPGGILGKR